MPPPPYGSCLSRLYPRNQLAGMLFEIGPIFPGYSKARRLDRITTKRLVDSMRDQTVFALLCLILDINQFKP
ncbi:MAG: hypothetical protein B1H13_03430 [Desulfobacteraceae bacterium 4484_190.3]|nr:MAG: hypothetical protein B1H13_03430 [Desulfobacteraceae bacterium 4484_190.3]